MTRVLVFEDEVICQEMTQLALHRLGIPDITLAPDGATGLKIFDYMAPKPNLIICDIFMPEKDGIEIVGALVKRKFTGGLILLTGADAQFLHIAKTIAISNGLNYLGWLGKPFNDEALASALLRLSEPEPEP